MPWKDIETRRLKQKLQKQKKRNMMRTNAEIPMEIPLSPKTDDNPIIEPVNILINEPVNKRDGYIYCLSNPAFIGIYKIGHTKISITQRLSQLNNTSVPFNFKCEFYKKVDDCINKEKHLHSIFTIMGCRVNDKREFFKVDLLLIKSIFALIDEIL